MPREFVCALLAVFCSISECSNLLWIHKYLSLLKKLLFSCKCLGVRALCMTTQLYNHCSSGSFQATRVPHGCTF